MAFSRIIVLVLLLGALSGCADPGLRSAPAREVPAAGRVVFAGDFSFGENYLEEMEAEGRENVLETQGYDYNFEKLDPLLLDADLVIANLETAVTDLPHSPFEGKKYYIHWTDPARAPAAMKRHNIRAVTLANNHGFDFGIEGLRQTLASLDSAGIVHFGAGMNAAEAARPFVHDLHVEGKRVRMVVVGGFEHAPHYERTYNFFAHGDSAGVNDWTPEGAASQIRAIRAADPDAYIVAFPHWGYNFRWKNFRQLDMGRAVIDAGADLVIGHSGHMLQEIDRYRGRWIVYGIGNSIFNSPGEYEYYGIHPYSFVAAFDASEAAGKIAMKLRLYPIYSDNIATNFQPGPLAPDDVDAVAQLLLDRGPVPRVLREGMTRGRDDFGAFFELDVTPPAERGATPQGG